MKKLVSALLLASLLFALVACGNSGTASTPSGTPPSTAPSAAVSVPEPEPEPLEVAFLTGREKTVDYPEGQRIAAVMVSNIAGSRPLRGLSDAEMLVEIKTEAGITRFMAIYEDYKTIPEVGPVRSVRDQFFQILLPFWGFYVHDGESTVQKQYFIDWEYKEFNLDSGWYSFGKATKDTEKSLTWRDQARINAGYKTEYTEYTAGDHIDYTVQNNGLDDYRSYGSPIFAFVPYTDAPRVPAEGSMSDIAITHSAGYRTLFQYDTSLQQYGMSMWNSYKGVLEKTVDENNNEQLAFDNVLVLFAPMSLYSNSPLVKVDYGNGGPGYYFSQGGYELVIWRKGGPTDPLRILSPDGTETAVKINVGNTYLAVVDDKELGDFYNVLKSGTGEQTAGEGETIENENETED